MLNLRRINFEIIMAILLGSTLCLSFPPINLYYLVFVTITIFILILEKSNNKFLFGYLFYFIAVNFFIDKWFSIYFMSQLDLGFSLSYLITICISLYTGLYVGIISYIYSRIKTKFLWFNLLFLFPSLWVMTELIRGLIFPRSWYAIGNTQITNIFLKGWYPVFGVYFVSWLVLAVCGAIIYIILNIFLYKKYKVAMYSWLLLILFNVISYKISDIQYTHKNGSIFSVNLVQPNIFSSKIFSYANQKSLEDEVYSLVEKTHANLIILPETVFNVNYQYLTKGYLKKLYELIIRKKSNLFFGSSLYQSNSSMTGTLYLNKLIPVYKKHFLVPIGEYIPLIKYFPNKILDIIFKKFNFSIPHYISGEYHQEPFELNGNKFSFNICYENAINDYVAQNSINATVIINQSDISWYGKTYMKDLSLQLSQVRALENQRFVLQDSTTAETAVINNHGIVIKILPSFTKGNLSEFIQGYSGRTPFETMLNFPVWFICILFIFIAYILKK